MPPLTTPLQTKKFNLDSSGIAGFFGGDEAILAMATVHIYEGRRWLGWYNSPGSAIVARRYGQLTRAKTWRALFPGERVDPDSLFGFSGNTGPAFIATYSGTTMANSGQMGYFFMRKCQSLNPATISGRTTSAHTVTIAYPRKLPAGEIDVASWRPYRILPACIPISYSVAACTACGIFQDWYSFSMILLGIVSNGISCFVIGSAKLTFTRPIPANGAPPGDGFLKTSSEFVCLRGEEEAVNSVTRGSFTLKFKGEPEYRAIGISAALLGIQFLLQLLIIPQGTLFGQIMFLSSLAVSWGYNCYLASLAREMVEPMVKKVLGNPSMARYLLGTRTAAVVFLVLALETPTPAVIFDQLLPDTATWRIWKQVVTDKLKSGQSLSFDQHDLNGVSNDEERRLLERLFRDAADAYTGYLSIQR